MEAMGAMDAMGAMATRWRGLFFFLFGVLFCFLSCFLSCFSFAVFDLPE
jgi:hypothetical protein